MIDESTDKERIASKIIKSKLETAATSDQKIVLSTNQGRTLTISVPKNSIIDTKSTIISLNDITNIQTSLNLSNRKTFKFTTQLRSTQPGIKVESYIQKKKNPIVIIKSTNFLIIQI